MTRGKLIILISLFTTFSLFSILTIYHTHQLPTEKTTTSTLGTYKHTGTYDYIAKLKSNIIYNQSTLKPDQGILYIAITEYINTTFSYIFESSLQSNITIEYNINLALESTKWPHPKTFNIVPQKTLSSMGTQAELSNNYLVNVALVQEWKNAIEEETGARVRDFNLTIRPEIHTSANNNVSTINEYVTPTLTMTFRYGTSEGSFISTTGLEHIKPGAITHTEKLSIDGVINQRYASYAFFAITLSGLAITALAFTRTLKPTLKPKMPMEDIIAPYEEVIAESAGEPSYKGQMATITMETLEDLVKVADWLDKPVLSYRKPSSLKSKESTRIFYVLDGTTKYECTISAPTKMEEAGVETKKIIEKD